MEHAPVCADKEDHLAVGAGVQPLPVQWVDGTVFARFTFTAAELANILDGGSLLLAIKSPSGSFTPICPMITSGEGPLGYLDLKRLAEELNKPV